MFINGFKEQANTISFALYISLLIIICDILQLLSHITFFKLYFHIY